MFGFLRNWPKFTNLRAELRGQLEIEGATLIADKVGVDHAFSGTKLNYKRNIPDEVLRKLPTSTLAFRLEPMFFYRADGVRPRV